MKITSLSIKSLNLFLSCYTISKYTSPPHGASADNILDTGDVAPDIDEALGLVAVREVVDDAVGEEVRRHGVTTKTAHVRPQNTENFIEELLDEG